MFQLWYSSVLGMTRRTGQTGWFTDQRTSVRIFTLVFVILAAIFQSRLVCLVQFSNAPIDLSIRTATPLSHCQLTLTVASAFYPVAVSLTCLLLFLRLRAVFYRNTLVILFFFALWLGVVGGNIPTVIAVHGVHLGPTRYCIVDGLKNYTYIAPLFAAIHDTLAFVAISWRLLGSSWDEEESTTIRRNARIFVLGERLPAFSRMMLRDGQLYFWCVVFSPGLHAR